MAVISVLIYHTCFPQLLVFFAFILFYVQIPGLLILDALKMSFSHISSRLAVGLFTGWALSVLTYFLDDLIPADFLLYAYGPLCTLLFLYKGFKGGFKNSQIFKIRPRKISNAFCIFIILVFTYAMIRTQFIYMDPDFREMIYMNPDKGYHIGLINSLSHDYPLISPWVQNRTISYHIFSEVLYSIPVRLFGMDADFILLSCCPYLTTYTFTLSTYSLFKELCSRKDRAGVYSLLVILANLFLIRSPQSSIALSFALVNENTIGYGISCAMVFIVLLNNHCIRFDRFQLRRNCVASTVLLTAILMLETGIKGPMGIVLLAGMWGTYLLGLILKKVHFSNIIPLLFSTAGFLIVYVAVLGTKGQTNGGGNSIIAAATISNICFWKSAVVNFLKSLGLPLIVRLAVVLIVFMLFMLTIYFLPFCIGYIRELILVISKKKNFDFTKVTVYASVLVGLIAMFLLNYSGHSQIYFGFISVFFAPIISYWFIEDLEAIKQKNTGHSILLKSMYIVIAASLVFTTIGFIKASLNAIDQARLAANPNLRYDEYLSISNAEYDAMTWIKENTDKDALLATDRYYSVPLDQYSYKNRWDNRFFLYSDYANRFCYISGSGYNFPADGWKIRKQMLDTNARLYDLNNEYRGQEAKNLGINYVVVSLRYNNVGDLSCAHFIKCYSNEDVIIYEVR